MKTYLFFAIGVLLLIIVSCSNDEKLTYQPEDTGLNFVFSKSSIGQEYFYNFAFLNKPEEEISLRFRVQGTFADYDRVIPLETVETDTINNAIENVHFRIESSDLIVPKGKLHADVPITFFKTEDLRDTIVTIQLRLKTNDDFKQGVLETSFADITLSDNFIVLPVFWTSYRLDNPWTGFGRSDDIIIRKYTELGNITESGWISDPYSKKDILVAKTKKWFNENPTLGDDGEIIVFP